MVTLIASTLMILIDGLVALPAALVLNKAWGFIACAFDLPVFEYWSMFFITWALLIIRPDVHTGSSEE